MKSPLKLFGLAALVLALYSCNPNSDYKPRNMISADRVLNTSAEDYIASKGKKAEDYTQKPVANCYRLKSGPYVKCYSSLPTETEVIVEFKETKPLKIASGIALVPIK